tara:strand:- start:103 stop:258 length:156 start_codon:yes stop_codon:yes gene_type:complete
VSHELTQEIEKMLRTQCAARALDDEEDIKAVVMAINNIVEDWISDRCPGCR